MATPKTHRLIRVADSVTRLGAATRARRRLQEEAILLNRGISSSQKRLAEIDEEETVLAAAIDEHGDAVAAANAEPSESEISGNHR